MLDLLLIGTYAVQTVCEAIENSQPKQPPAKQSVRTDKCDKYVTPIN
jgi:hypothetical protein